ncbi:DUF1353 domain-containing protein [Sphingomonas ginkgonis]|uniref:DUF1353 domain-containing protein n=2 Tax=Sphingomonas ginkgonis TaxID=2315330 RepID=A0A3R9WPA4_9SPHN|nr:DUF1353 domain-containing protein [Sphingomonas ginkgonis]
MPEERNGEGLFRVAEAFGYEIGSRGSGDWVWVPVGFMTDLCTVPWFARPFIPLSGKVAKPALLHDWLLTNGDPRAIAVFAEALKVAQVRRGRRGVLLAAVKLWACWRRVRATVIGRPATQGA